METTYLESKCLSDLFLEQVRERPDRTAVVHEHEHLTYRELAARSADLAGYLRYLGVDLDTLVGVFVEPSLDLMVGVWGILLSGGAYVPLSPEYPEARLRYMIEDSRARVIFSQDELAPRLASLAPPGTVIVTWKTAADHARSRTSSGRREPGTGWRANSLAYVIYTSGSTGKPKGVMIEHRSIVNQMRWLSAAYRLGRETTILQKTPMSFDAAQWEILAPSCGSEVVMGSPGVYRDPERLIETITKHEVTALQCVPTLLQALLDTDELQRCTSLVQIFSGGEALSRNLALRCLEALPECELVNLYGPTECTINALAFTVGQDAARSGPNMIPIGTPVHGTRYYILDEDRSPVTAGEIGELYISGVQLARGYLHRQDLTADRFIGNPFDADPQHPKLYRTGDLASWNLDGTVQFAGRFDNQVKLRGFRIELDEIRLAIEAHNWVRRAAVIVKPDPHTGFQSLIAFVELNPKEAALMDQGNHGAHHHSKASKLQVKAQLSNLGCRDLGGLSREAVIDLPGKVPTEDQRRRVFARKTYRFFEGGKVEKAEILRLLGRRVTAAAPRSPGSLSTAEFGEILRYFGQFVSSERLLPKYGYASPGALYLTQMYLELTGLGGLQPGFYYYHPVHHQLALISGAAGEEASRIKLHFIGKKQAMEPVYKNNIREVLEIETGHMIGLFEEILPGYGLDVTSLEYAPATKDHLQCAEADDYLGTFEIVPYAWPRPEPELKLYVQAHPGKVADLQVGHYSYRDGGLEPISDELVLKKHVIAINQQVHERSSLGITVISKTRTDWMSYIDLGRELQRLQMNDLNLGFMSAGYSSRTGNDLPSAGRIDQILSACGTEAGPSYFFVGGRISDEQVRSEGMKEDMVHMKGPAEMIKDDLVSALPDYMVPNAVIVLDQLPLTANGKIAFDALAELDHVDAARVERPFIPPRSETEQRLAELWKRALHQEAVSVHDDFLESGGNSLIAVRLINNINREFQSSLPLQILLTCPTIAQLAHEVTATHVAVSSRLVRLLAEGSKRPIYCWPGLGGYPMNLRLLATRLGLDRPFYGIQAHGINDGETPYSSIKEMAEEDIKIIRRSQPTGPYMLWGYSFGARVAFEVAYQLERSGERVGQLFLIAPGSPDVRVDGEPTRGRESVYRDRAYVRILLSVFAGSTTHPALDECLQVANDDESFASFIVGRFEGLGRELVARIARTVRETYEFEYTFRELAERQINAPVTIFKARGDDYSFIENSRGYSSELPTVIELNADHYSMLRDPDVEELVERIRERLHADHASTSPPRAPRAHAQQSRERQGMPHINIKHFPISLSEEQLSQLVTAVTQAVKAAFRCDEGVISVALEPVEKERWNEQVYIPEIVNRKDLLCKPPSY